MVNCLVGRRRWYAKRCFALRLNVIVAIFTVLLRDRMLFAAHALPDSHLCFFEFYLGSTLPHRHLWCAGLYHVWIEWMRGMHTLALGLIRGHEKDLRKVPYAIQLRCYILEPECECVNPIDQNETLIGECPYSPFLGL